MIKALFQPVLEFLCRTIGQVISAAGTNLPRQMKIGLFVRIGYGAFLQRFSRKTVPAASSL
ncbi:hypothetical protein [Teichococcus vastitatis]|uniref:hypothetical protein n=1 Tax=Teichococcus vastitatis TaxID=2307076 RepID=UPI000E70EFED|nr:hypothetical protein [Pseudoroseomonas vastitatis]